MKIKLVTFGRTISKNYQSKRAEVTLELHEDESFKTAMETAKTLVEVALEQQVGSEQIQKVKAALES